MKAQHTPGPWKTEYQQYEDGSHVCIADKDGNWISDCGPEGDQQSEANARLIAAAPELLRVLKIMVGVHNGEWYRARNVEAIEIIRKAEGRDVA